jgi:hypothetical protein
VHVFVGERRGADRVTWELLNKKKKTFNFLHVQMDICDISLLHRSRWVNILSRDKHYKNQKKICPKFNE